MNHGSERLTDGGNVKELYGHEVPFMLRLIGAWRINTNSIDFGWGYFAPRCGFELMMGRGGYFNQRYSITICLIYGVFHIYLPFKTKIPESCDTPRYGVQIHNNTLWVHLGGNMNNWDQCDSRWITWGIPFFDWVFDVHQVWNSEGWITAAKGEYSAPYSDRRLVETHPYRYVLKSGVVQERDATVHLSRRRWHRKWFPFLKMSRTSIEVDFSDEIGERTGSWKGGCVGCSFNAKPGETMLETLRCMEGERKF